jgi:menaquinone-dependent protoporphyrinogen oxidase
MKGVIIYSSKTGTTKKCADYVKEKTEFDLFDLRGKEFKKEFKFQNYDYFVLGAPFRMGMLDKPMKKFLKTYGNFLLDTKFAIFGIGITNNSYQQMRKYYDNLIDEAVLAVWLGGEIVTKDKKGLKLSLVTVLAAQYEKEGRPLPELNQSDLEKFTIKINSPDSQISFENDMKNIINEEEDDLMEDNDNDDFD